MPDAPADPHPGPPPGMLRAVLDDRILTLPNVITLSRLLLVPVYISLVRSSDYDVAAAVLAVMGATDWIDGQVARRTGQVSELGKILDPAADRIVLMIAVITMVTNDLVPAWIWVPVLVREPIMFVAVPLLAVMGATRIDVTWFGKAGTFLLMFTFPMLLYGASDAPGAEVLEMAAYATAVPGIILSWYAAIMYIPMAREALREGRAEAAAGGVTP